MHSKTGLAMLSTVALLIPMIATAQEAGQAGIAMGYPGAIGVVYHVSDSVAVRPEFSVSRTTTGSSSSLFPTESTGWATGLGASALFYFAKRDDVRTYVSPRFGYSRTSSTLVSTGSGTVVDTVISHTDGYSGSGSFGAQYTPSRRFGIFGEIGVSYTHSKAKTGTSGIRLTSNSVGTRTAVGAIFYF